MTSREAQERDFRNSNLYWHIRSSWTPVLLVSLKWSKKGACIKWLVVVNHIQSLQATYIHTNYTLQDICMCKGEQTLVSGGQ